jgi:cytoskeletal protein CcmA (bactofilin family)
MAVPNSVDLQIRGELTAEEDLTIDYEFEGSIRLPGHQLTIGPHARVQAAATAQGVTVHGHFEGQVEADVLRVTATAELAATAVVTKLVVQDGAIFVGSVNTERARAAGEVARHRAAANSKP